MEKVPALGRRQQRLRISEKRFGFIYIEWSFVGPKFVNLRDQLGQRPQPLERRVVDDKLKCLTGRLNGSVLSLVSETLVIGSSLPLFVILPALHS